LLTSGKYSGITAAMSCTTALVVESYEEPALGSSSSRQVQQPHLRRRRHSSYHPTHWTLEPENIQLLVWYSSNTLPATVLTTSRSTGFSQNLIDALTFWNHTANSISTRVLSALGPPYMPFGTPAHAFLMASLMPAGGGPASSSTRLKIDIRRHWQQKKRWTKKFRRAYV